jgi:hypothetical protein
LLKAKLSMDHPDGVDQSSFEYRGVRVSASSSRDGALRQRVARLPEVADVGPVTLVSNSDGAVRRIIDVALGAGASLAAEPDFQYMLERDAQVPSDVLAYLGDAFVAAATSPRQRILDARRQLARAELTRLGAGALLFAWLEGQPPKEVTELLATKWLDKSALRHTTGEKITFEVAEAPRSAWGTPAFLEPIVDLPTPLKVTPAEKEAYESFARSYQSEWSDHVDPIAVRSRVQRAPGSVRLESHLRVLPVLGKRDYREIQRLTGTGQVQSRSSFPGFHATLAIGKDSEPQAAPASTRAGLPAQRGALPPGPPEVFETQRWVRGRGCAAAGCPFG